MGNLAIQSATNAAFAAMQARFHAGCFGDAALLGWELLKADPTEPKWLNLLALAEHQAGNHAAAVVLLKRAIKAQPDGVAQWNDLGNVYGVLKENALAEEAYRQALVCAPDCAETYNNLGVLASEVGDYAEARRLCEIALTLRPDYAEAVYNLGIILAGMGKFQKAVRRYEQTIALLPDHPRARFNLSLTHLLLGDFALGWKHWESRWLTPQLAPALRTFPQPAWKGESLTGKRILLYAEQGMGDTLQFVRYLPLVAAKGAVVILEVQAPLVPLFAPLFPGWVGQPSDGAPPGGSRLVAQGEQLPHFDLHCSLMSLPAVFKTTVNTLPFAAGYLRPDLPLPGEHPYGALKVGIVWAGSVTHKRDHERSFSLSVWRPLFDLPHIRWVSLQKGPPAAELAALGSIDPAYAAIEDATDDFHDYAATAAAIDTLDLVITVDTSVAHLAGAMGKPVWILLHKHFPDWRWLLDRKDSPWYRSARLFRQSGKGDWEGVVAEVAQELKKLVDRRVDTC